VEIDGGYLNSYSNIYPLARTFLKDEAISANPYEFIGQWGVTENSDERVFMRARFYDNQLGRFRSTDPIGISSGDINLYRYVENNPVLFADPTGLQLADSLLDIKRDFP
jgi:RHS repeat-associated protein